MHSIAPTTPIRIFAVLLLSLLMHANGKLVLVGYDLEEISEDTEPLSPGAPVGPRISGGNSGFSTSRRYDDCSHAGGLVYPLGSGGKNGFVAINDCFVTWCNKYRGSNTASACDGSDCVSQTNSDTGGSNKVYRLVEKFGDSAVVFWGFDPDIANYPCSCSGGVVTLNPGFSSCKVGGSWDAIEDFNGNGDSSCAYRDFGEPLAPLGCSQGSFASTHSLLPGLIVSLLFLTLQI